MEDFLTEALSDILGRLPAVLANDFVCHRLLADGRARIDWPAIAPGRTLLTRTQRYITEPQRGFVDLLIEDGAQSPLIVIESKIYSSIRTHSANLDSSRPTQVEPEIEELQSQLTTYESWLKTSRKGLRWPGAVVLLSHGTPPPPKFLERTPAVSDAPYRSVVSWREIGRWLLAAIQDQEASDNRGWKALATEMVAFLRENGMNPDVIGPSELAAMQLFLPGFSRIQATFARISKVVIEENGPIIKTSGLDLDGSGRVYWEWAYPKPPVVIEKSSWYVAWGFRFPEGSTWWEEAEPKLPTRPQAFVSIGTENRPLNLSVGNLTGWSKTGTEAISAMALSEFPDAAEEFAVAVTTWISAQVRDALAILNAMVGHEVG